MNAPIASRFLLPAAAVDAVASKLTPAFNAAHLAAPSAPAARAYVEERALRPEDGYYVDAGRKGSFASLGAVLEAARLDFPVQSVPVHDPEGRKVDSHRIIRRADTGEAFGVVSPDYAAIDAVDAFGALLGPAIAAGALVPERAGLILGRAFVQARLAIAPREIVEGDTILPYVTATHTWDGKSSTNAGPTAVRIVCRNTAAAAHKECGEKGWRVTKRGGATVARMEAIGESVAAIARQFNTLCDAFGYIAHRSLDSKTQRGILERLFSLHAAGDRAKLDKLVQTIDRLQHEGRGAKLPGVRGTSWGFLNALTEYNEHERPVRAPAQLTEGDWRWRGVLDGEVQAFNGDAYVEVFTASGMDRGQALRAIAG